MTMRILGISGSPVGGGNVEYMLGAALEEIDGDRVQTTALHLSSLKVEGCRHCNWCIKKQTEDRFCAVRDDMDRIYSEATACDGLLIATPVHLGRMSGQLACALDRFRAFVHGAYYRGVLRNKVGGALAVSFFRNSGAERALADLHWLFHTFNLIVATPDFPHLGAVAYASIKGEGQVQKGLRHQVSLDEMGMASARATAKRVVELVRLTRQSPDGPLS